MLRKYRTLYLGFAFKVQRSQLSFAFVFVSFRFCLVIAIETCFHKTCVQQTKREIVETKIEMILLGKKEVIASKRAVQTNYVSKHTHKHTHTQTHPQHTMWTTNE